MQMYTTIYKNIQKHAKLYANSVQHIYNKYINII